MAQVERNPRLIKRGDVIQVVTTLDEEVEDVVREVQIFVTLGNGQTARLPLDQNVVVVTDESISDELIQQIEEMNEPAPPGEPELVVPPDEAGHGEDARGRPARVKQDKGKRR